MARWTSALALVALFLAGGSQNGGAKCTRETSDVITAAACAMHCAGAATALALGQAHVPRRSSAAAAALTRPSNCYKRLFWREISLVV
jgi:hypothetical protein